MATKTDSTLAAEFASALSEENVSRLDFDALRTWLTATATKLGELERTKNENALLRQDLESRITGMLKAIVIARRSRKDHGAIGDLIDSLSEMPSDALIACYRRTAARFRDAFPASFALVTSAGTRSERDVSDFK